MGDQRQISSWIFSWTGTIWRSSFFLTGRLWLFCRAGLNPGFTVQQQGGCRRDRYWWWIFSIWCFNWTKFSCWQTQSCHGIWPNSDSLTSHLPKTSLQKLKHIFILLMWGQPYFFLTCTGLIHSRNLRCYLFHSKKLRRCHHFSPKD